MEDQYEPFKIVGNAEKSLQCGMIRERVMVVLTPLRQTLPA